MERKLGYLIAKMREDLEKLENCRGAKRKEVLELVAEGYDLHWILIELFY